MSATMFLVDRSRIALDPEPLLLVPGEKRCALCGDDVGLVEDSDPNTERTLGWVDYYEVMADGDSAPTHLDQQCLDWLIEVGPALLG